MEITLTAKVRLDVSKQARPLLKESMDRYRDACNYVSEYVCRTYELRSIELHKALYRDLRSRFSLKAQLAQSVIRTVVARYRTLRTNKMPWARIRFKKPQMDLVWNRDYSLVNGLLSVNTLQGRLKIPYFSHGMEKFFDKDNYRFGTAKLVLKHEKWYLHISVATIRENISPKDITNVVGIDRGINFLMATYDSNGRSGFVSGKSIKQMRAHYKNLRTQLQQRKTPSARRRLKAIGQRENRWMRDVNHCISKALVENNPSRTLFVLEDLKNVRKTTERVKRKDRYVSVSWAYYDLEQKLAYKAALAGSLIIKVDPAYTSQRCPVCGHTERSNRDKKLHRFLCKKCGYQSNDDRVAAMNLYQKGMHYLVPNTVACG